MNAGADPGWLQRFALFEGADPEALAAAARVARWRRAAPGEQVLRIDEPTDEVILIHAGTVRVSVPTAGGQEVIVGDRYAGEIVGEFAAIDGRKRSASVTALHRSTLGLLPGPAFMALVLPAPAIAHRVMALLTAHLRRDQERLLEFALLPVRNRLYAELLRLARPREAGALRISPPPPRQVLAARIGARREAVSRELSAMRSAGLALVTRQAITLPCPAVLQAANAAALGLAPAR